MASLRAVLDNHFSATQSTLAHPQLERIHSLSSLRAIYRTAARSFLHKDHLSVWISLCKGLEAISGLLDQSTSDIENDHQPWWANDELVTPSPSAQGSILPTQISLDRELHELARKFNILRITFVVSIYASSSAIHTLRSLDSTQASSDHRGQIETLLRLLALQPDLLISTLWTMTVSRQTDLESFLLRSQASEALSPIWVSDVHPSIVTAAALASIKISAPQTGRDLCEAWISSLNVVTLDFLEMIMRVEQTVQLNTTCDSVLSLNHSTNQDTKRGGSNIAYNYARLIEVYVVHILGSLDDWHFAKEFLNAQSCDMGGVLPSELVKVCKFSLIYCSDYISVLIGICLEKRSFRIWFVCWIQISYKLYS